MLILCQFSDSATYPRTLTKIKAINPAEIIIPGSIHDSVKLYNEVEESVPLANVQRVQRKYFSDNKGLHLVRHLCVEELQSVELQFRNKFYSLAAANALIKFLEHSQGINFPPKSVKVEYQVPESSTIIDPETAEQIELMNCLVQKKSAKSLFAVMNQCSTPGGVRLLRSNLFQV